LACDLRFAADHARFAVPATRLGLSYPMEAIERLVQVVGPGAAADILLSARTLDAAYHAHDFLSEITRTGTAIDRYLTAFETNTRDPVLLQDRLTTLQAKTAQRKALVEQLIQRGLWRPRIRTGFRSSPVRSSAW